MNGENSFGAELKIGSKDMKIKEMLDPERLAKIHEAVNELLESNAGSFIVIAGKRNEEEKNIAFGVTAYHIGYPSVETAVETVTQGVAQQLLEIVNAKSAGLFEKLEKDVVKEAMKKYRPEDDPFGIFGGEKKE